MPTDTLAAQDRAAAAIIAAAQAAADHTAEVMEADGQPVTAKVSNDLLRTELDAWVASIVAGSPLRAQIQGYVDQLALIPTDINTQIVRRAD